MVVLLTIMLLWALCFPLITTGVRYAPPLHMAAMRAALAGSSLVLLGALLGRPRPERRDWGFILVIGIMQTTVGFAGMFLSGGHIGPGLATVLASTQPLMAAVIGSFALNEPVRSRGVLAILLGFAGIVVASARALGGDAGDHSSLRGVATVLMGAFGVACSNVLMKRLPARTDAIWVTGCQLLVGAIPLAIAARATESSDAVRWSAPLLIAVPVLALLSSALAFVLWLEVLRRVPLNSANAFNYATPVFGLLIAAAFYGETLTYVEIAGSVLVVGAGYLASSGSRA
ncbi:DMT family transporter [Sorangium sp. So ce1182]|uniref:DMT family transporter n=1 Tax=Sorangium sp. So ce1182 TaxID=3133334 RepID=UPI003F63834F